jgi:hypothetical protein
MGGGFSPEHSRVLHGDSIYKKYADGKFIDSLSISMDIPPYLQMGYDP